MRVSSKKLYFCLDSADRHFDQHFGMIVCTIPLADDGFTDDAACLEELVFAVDFANIYSNVVNTAVTRAFGTAGAFCIFIVFEEDEIARSDLADVDLIGSECFCLIIRNSRQGNIFRCVNIAADL